MPKQIEIFQTLLDFSVIPVELRVENVNVKVKKGR